MKRIIALVIAIIIAAATIGQPIGLIPKHTSADLKTNSHPSSFLHTPNSPQPNSPQPNRLLPAILKQKLDSLVSERWDIASNSWVNNMKHDYTYDFFGVVNSNSNYHWDLNDNNWIGDNKFDYTFYDPQHPSIILENDWDYTGSIWVPFCKSEYNYDGNWNLVLLLKCYPVGTTGQWQALFRTEYYYDAGMNLLGEVESIWKEDDSQWTYATHTEYSYDENNDMSMQIKYLWNSVLGDWVPSQKYDLSYNIDGIVLSKIESEWDANGIEWLPLFKYDYTYDNNGNKTVEITSEWSLPNLIWTLSEKTEYNYEAADGGLKYETDFLWDTSILQWLVDNKKAFTYTNAYSFSDMVLPYEFMGNTVNFKYMLNGLLYYSFVNNNFIPTYNEKYSYSLMNVIGIDEPEAVKIQVYPNPASDFVIFGWKDNNQAAFLEISDLTGKCVFQTSIHNKSAVPLGDLSTGLYFYKLIDGLNKISIGKLGVR